MSTASIISNPINWMFKQYGFQCDTGEDSWIVKYTNENGNTYVDEISYKAVPKNSCKEYVLGYCRCLAIQKKWLTIN